MIRTVSPSLVPAISNGESGFAALRSPEGLSSSPILIQGQE